MENEFIPYEQALALKELGFDEPCLAWYNIKGVLLSDITIGYESSDFLYQKEDMDNNQCIVPTFSQAFRWFREKYNSHHSITRLPQGALDADNKNNKVLKKYAWFISKDDLNPTIPNDGSGKCDTYEEAELACLKKLIEIIKTK